MRGLVRTAPVLIAGVVRCSLGFPGSPAASGELLIFGGEDHGRFLGCLPGGRYDPASICNPFAQGSQFRPGGIFNAGGTFGSRYSPSRPWNGHSLSDAVPVIVDEAGNFHGRLTFNPHRHDAMPGAKSLRDLYAAGDGDLETVRDLICERMR
jgi:hypothetical protein